MKVFGYEPAAIIGAVQVLAIMAVSFHWLDFIGLQSQNDVMTVVVVLSTLAAIALAYKTHATLLAPVIELFKALAAVAAIYGLHISTEQTGAVIAAITGLLALFQRTQVTPLLQGNFSLDGTPSVTALDESPGLS